MVNLDGMSQQGEGTLNFSCKFGNTVQHPPASTMNIWNYATPNVQRSTARRLVDKLTGELGTALVSVGLPLATTVALGAVFSGTDPFGVDPPGAESSVANPSGVDPSGVESSVVDPFGVDPFGTESSADDPSSVDLSGADSSANYPNDDDDDDDANDEEPY